MGKKLLILLTFLFLPVLSYSQEVEHPIDTWYNNCITVDGSTIGMIMCADSAAVLWDIELNKNYNLLMGMLGENAKESLRDAQREWIKFRDEEWEAINAYYEYIYELMQGGTMYPMLASGARMEVVRKRALDIKGMYDELNAHIGDPDDN